VCRSAGSTARTAAGQCGPSATRTPTWKPRAVIFITNREVSQGSRLQRAKPEEGGFLIGLGLRVSFVL
jgi:hypothetical protein